MFFVFQADSSHASLFALRRGGSTFPPEYLHHRTRELLKLGQILS